MNYFTGSRIFRCAALAVLLLAVGDVWLGGALVWGCPNCRDALAGDPAQAGLVRGLFWSIVFMVSMPFLILTGIVSYFYWEVCRANRAAVTGAESGALAECQASPFAESDVGSGSEEAIENQDLSVEEPVAVS